MKTWGKVQTTSCV